MNEAASWLEGKRVAVAGPCGSLSHQEFAAVVADQGGVWDRRPTRRTDYLVLGENLLAQGISQPAKSVEAARRWQSLGSGIEILSESTFWERLSGAGERSLFRRYSLGELAHLASMPRDRVRAWLRCGLIKPNEQRLRVPYFDFTQVQRARLVGSLLEQGASIAEIRTMLGQLERRSAEDADAGRPGGYLSAQRRVLQRDANDRLVELGGQIWFDFDLPEGAEPIEFAPRRAADDWFDEAVELEDVGQFAAAAAAYREAIRLEPRDAVIHFNLANALFMQDHLLEAAEAYVAALAIDPNYAEAWNNVGSVWALTGEADRALAAFRKALERSPAYADAMYNLADAYESLGDAEAAAPWWRRFLALDATSPWAEYARRQLETPRSAGTAGTTIRLAGSTEK